MNRLQRIGLPAASQQLEALRQLLRLGDLARLCDDSVADLVTGLTLAKLLQDPAVFGQPMPRPRLPIEAACGSWPPKTAAYTENGQLIEPSLVLAYPNVQVGYALTTPEVRAALLGLMAAGPLNCEQLKRLRETFRTLATAGASTTQQTFITQNTTTTNTINAALPRAIIDTNGSAGDVVRWNGANHLEVATGEFIDDQETVVGILGAAATAGQETDYYPSGSKTPPIAGLTLGRVYRHRDGSAKNAAALIAGDYSLQLGVANGDGRIDVTIDAQDFLVPEPADP